MSVEYSLSQVPSLVGKDVSGKINYWNENRISARAAFKTEQSQSPNHWERAKNRTSYEVNKIRTIGENLYLGTYLTIEDAFLTSIYVNADAKLGPVAAVGATTLATYWLNRTGTHLYQDRFVKGEVDDFTAQGVRIPMLEAYLSAAILNKVGIKPHSVETLVLGSYYGAEQEQRELERTNVDRIREGLDPLLIDQQKIGKKHSRLFTYEIGGMSAATAILGEQFAPIEQITEAVFNPKVLLPALGGVYVKRYIDGLREKVRTEPTLPKKAANRMSASFNRVFKREKSGKYALAEVIDDKPAGRVNPPPVPPSEDAHIAHTD